MNLNEFVFNKEKNRNAGPINSRLNNRNVLGNNVLMGPPRIPAPRIKPTKPSSSSSASINWGKPNSVNSTLKSPFSSKTNMSEDDSKIILAITEGRGHAQCEVGLALIDTKRPKLILCQISDTQSYINTLRKVNIFNPDEIISPATFSNSFNKNRMLELIQKHFPKIKQIEGARNTFNNNAGFELIKDLCIPSLDPILLVLQHRYYALSAAAGLLNYIVSKLFIYYAHGTIKVEYEESEGYAIIDVGTADVLELVASTKPAQANKYGSLFGILNNCFTKIGTRTLRSSILQPLFNKDYLNQRIRSVEELMKKPETLIAVQGILQKVSNIDILLSLSTILPNCMNSCTNRHLNYILLLHSVLDLLSPLNDLLKNHKTTFFVQLCKTLNSEEFKLIQTRLQQSIHSNAHQAKGQAADYQRCFAIKAGENQLLDILRQVYSKLIVEMREYVENLAEKYNLPLTLNNNQMKGYHIVLSLKQQQRKFLKIDLPEEFIQVQRLAASFTLKTLQLMDLSVRTEDVLSDILNMSNVMLFQLISECKQYSELFYKLVEGVAQLDVLQSLAQASLIDGRVKPIFADYTDVELAHHPILDYLLAKDPTGNDIVCNEDYNFHIITGPNGAGKSIYIRQVLLLQVMAQVGCYVPASAATFRPADRIFARVYLEDNMECGVSAFTLEIKEVNFILHTMTDDSLIIIDELCRSTSPVQGTALAMAICELLVKTKAFVYVTTHYMQLTKLYEMYPNIKLWQMETIEHRSNDGKVLFEFTYKLIPGVTPVENYGINLIEGIWPQCMLNYVYSMLKQVKMQSKIKMSGFTTALCPKLRLKYNAESKVRDLKRKNKLSVQQIERIVDDYRRDLSSVLGKEVEIIQQTALKTPEIINEQIPVEDFKQVSNNDNEEVSISIDSPLGNELMNMNIDDSSYIDEEVHYEFTYHEEIEERTIFQPATQDQDHQLSIQEDLAEESKSLEVPCEDVEDQPSVISLTEFSMALKNSEEPRTSTPLPRFSRELVGHYDHYLSPKVRVVEGEDNKSISFGSEGDKSVKVEQKPSKIVIISDQKIRLDLNFEDKPKKPVIDPLSTSTFEGASINNKKSSTGSQKSSPTLNGSSSSIPPKESSSSASVSNQKFSLISSDNSKELLSSAKAKNNSSFCSNKKSKEPSSLTTLMRTKSSSEGTIIFTSNKYSSENTSSSGNSVPKRRRLQGAKAEFVPPKKMTKKEIRQEFFEQDRKYLETGLHSTEDKSRYLKQRFNRPSVQQLQETQYLAFARRTEAGVEVLPVREDKSRKFTKVQKIRQMNVDPSEAAFFSDKNAKNFDDFLNSTEKNYKDFMLNKENPPCTLLQERGEILSLEDKFKQNFMKRVEMVRTPECLYKQNKMEIDDIVNKYLPPSSGSATKTISQNSMTMFQPIEFNIDWNF